MSVPRRRGWAQARPSTPAATSRSCLTWYMCWSAWASSASGSAPSSGWTAMPMLADAAIRTGPPPGELLCALSGGVRQQDHEFVAAPAAGSVGVARRLLQQRGESAQQAVASLVPVAVVDRLEAVQIDEDERERIAVPHAVRHRCCQFPVHAPAIEQAGQGVVIRHVTDHDVRLLRPLQRIPQRRGLVGHLLRKRCVERDELRLPRAGEPGEQAEKDRRGVDQVQQRRVGVRGGNDARGRCRRTDCARGEQHRHRDEREEQPEDGTAGRVAPGQRVRHVRPSTVHRDVLQVCGRRGMRRAASRPCVCTRLFQPIPSGAGLIETVIGRGERGLRRLSSRNTRPAPPLCCGRRSSWSASSPGKRLTPVHARPGPFQRTALGDRISRSARPLRVEASSSPHRGRVVPSSAG